MNSFFLILFISLCSSSYYAIELNVTWNDTSSKKTAVQQLHFYNTNNADKPIGTAKVNRDKTNVTVDLTRPKDLEFVKIMFPKNQSIDVIVTEDLNNDVSPQNLRLEYNSNSLDSPKAVDCLIS